MLREAYRLFDKTESSASLSVSLSLFIYGCTPDDMFSSFAIAD